MNDKVKYLLEPLLTRFFLIDALCCGFISEGERRGIFDELAKVFCVPVSSDIEAVYGELNREQYRKITDLSSYERLCRLIEYAESNGQNPELTLTDRTILSRKREAMTIKSTIFRQSTNLTEETIGDTLTEMAENGNIDAMTTLSFMEYHGICVCQDRENALKRLSHSARWNDLFANLMGIAYDAAKGTVCRNRLYTILRSSNQRSVFSHICEYTKYGGESQKDEVAGIIEKAFALGIAKRGIYDIVYANVAFSHLISVKDKEKLLHSKKKEILAPLSDIPFDVKKKQYAFDEGAAESIPLKRKGEMSKIFCSLSPAVKGKGAMYRPLLILSGDEYITDMYISSLKKGFEESNPIIEVDGEMLTVRDFDATKESFILRGLSDTKRADTVFLIRNCDKLGERELSELSKLLDYENRRRFKLSEPTVSLNLSDILIVLFANERSDRMRQLAEECDVVEAEKIKGTEKQTVIESLFEGRTKLFGCEDIKLGEGCIGYLASVKAGKMGRIMDGALKLAVYENRNVIVPEDLKNASVPSAVQTPKREFGYLGGVKNEKN